MAETRAAKGYVSSWRDDETDAIAEVAERFFRTRVMPRSDRWESQHFVDPDVWREAGDLGLLCCSIPEEYGGGGGTFAHDLAVFEAQARVGDSSLGNGVHSGIVAHYLLAYGSEEQRTRWLPRLCGGEWIGAIAMTEPGAGSDLQGIATRAVREDDHYVLNGSKTFITNGYTADLVVVVAKTDHDAGSRGISLIVVETADSPGYERGRKLDKVGQRGADTAELSFIDVRVPAANLLGEEGAGFGLLMTQLAQERLVLAAVAVAVMETALELTVDYVKQRQAFGQALFDFQNTRFTLAECATVTHAARVFLDSCIERHLRGEFDATTAAMAKYWLTEQQGKVVDECVQLFGGYGYIREYPIARMYADARVQRIYGGANEVMKEIIARSL